MLMLQYMSLFSIVFAVSIDGFGVGVTYGMRHIRLTLPALLIIMLASGTIVSLSMTIGHLIRTVISPDITSLFSSSMIVLTINLKTKFNWRLLNRKPFERFTSILSNPHKADKDKSGVISAGEAVILGIALAMDAFGAGFAAAILGHSVFITAISVGLMS